MARIVLEELTKVYRDGTSAVSALDLEIEDGEFVVLVGPSGCGKSTVLRMVAGIADISGGSIKIGDTVVNDLGASERDVAMVFQSYALYPHMTVFDNIAFPLKLRRMDKTAMRARVRDVAHSLSLEQLLERHPRTLSGGQRQRVAMGRAIARNPRAFLMDEPLSNLDASLRVRMRGEILRIQRDLGVTTVYVTHDQVEAMTMGDRVAVLRDGVLQQAAPPQELFDKPANTFVAGFIGSPSMNLFDGRLERRGDGLDVCIGAVRLALPDSVAQERPGLVRHVGRPLKIGLRPEHIEDAAVNTDPRRTGVLEATVELRERLGSEALVHFGVPAADGAALDAPGAIPFVARVTARSTAAEGERITFAVNTEAFHFFEADSGEAVRA
jgi:multiple sugar transport system ATP-binding protein